MDNEMDEISRLLKNNVPPAPNKFVENQAIDKAVAAFEKKYAVHAKGIAKWLRLMGTQQPKDGGIMKTSYKIAGGLAFASLAAVLLTSTSLRNDFMPPKEVVKEDLSTGAPVQPTQPVALPTVQAPLAEKVNAAESNVGQMQATDDKQTRSEGTVVAAPAPVAPPALASTIAQSEAAKKESVAAGGASMALAKRAGNYVTADMAMPSGIIAPEPYPQQPGYHDEGRDKFSHEKPNSVKLVKDEPVSTFSVDVDTASYAFVRAALNTNTLPQKDAVRVEEMINYFPYDYKAPSDKSVPFAAQVNVMPTPWNAHTKLVHIGIKGYELRNTKPHANLVFLIDTSGSMNEPNKLPLLKNSMKLLLESLQAEDTVAIVTYAGSAGTALEPTPVKDKGKILSALESLSSGGSTAGAEGIRQAYTLAERNFDAKGVNRVILATDGDFNVGITDPNELKSFIERKRDTGVTLSVLGFGQGNYNDALMQTLAQNGNGNASYIDTLNEARKVLVDEAGSTLFTIAKDVKLQVEFNPAKVAEYRLIGYETRMLNREDFNNDKVDAGDIGAGHTVTAIYEITPVGEASSVDPLRYQAAEAAPQAKKESANGNSEYAFLKIRYKLPKESTSKLITTPIDSKVEVANVNAATTDARFATAVAAFGQLLRGDPSLQSYSYDQVIALAQSAKGSDEFGYRAEFINLVRNAKVAAGMNANTTQAAPRPID